LHPVTGPAQGAGGASERHSYEPDRAMVIASPNTKVNRFSRPSKNPYKMAISWNFVTAAGKGRSDSIHRDT
jgi:hypothetical protein